LLGVLTRLPFVIPTPINWDAVQFALALDRFDLHDHQPHPPGYILYVLLGRAMRLFVLDPSLALSLLSVLFSALAAPLLYLLVLAILEDKWVAWCAAILLLASPLALYYGAVGLTYLPEMAASIAVALLAWRVHQTRVRLRLIDGRQTTATQPAASSQQSAARLALALGLTLGLAGGLRQTTLVVLLPLCVWALWGASRRIWTAFITALLATCLAWLVPLIAMSGGIEAYLRENARLVETASGQTSLFSAGLEGLFHNLAFIVLALTLGLGFGVVPLGLWAVRLLRFRLAAPLRLFVLLWVLPTLIFYALTHVGQYGYLLVILPPMLMLSALCARVLGERLASVSLRSGAVLALSICLAIALTSIAYFLLARGPVTAHSIWAHEARWQSLREALGNMDPERIVLIMQVDWESPFRLAGYLLPEYHSYAIGSASPGDEGPKGWLYSAFDGHSDYSLPHPQPETTLNLPPHTRRVVALDDETANMLSRSNGLTSESLPDGTRLHMLALPEGTIGALIAECGMRSTDCEIIAGGEE
jgi:hypothetical protein